LRYRGRTVTKSDVEFIRGLIQAHPGSSRRNLSEKLCEAWGWYQPNGTTQAMICRGLMLALDRGGHISLPPVRRTNPNPLAKRVRPREVTIEPFAVGETLKELVLLEFRQVRRTKEEALFNGLIEAYHYLGYTQPVGEHLKYLVYSRERPIACLAWSSAPRHLGPRDRYLGWNAEARRKNIRFVAYNPRYLILPFVKVPHLASHILGRMAKILPLDWNRIYGHPVYFLETFVDPGLYRGTCYYAANWIWLGKTTGRGKNDSTNKPNRSIKDVLGYPLSKDFRERLGYIA